MALVNQDLVLDVVPGPIPPTLYLTEYDENMEVVVTLMRRGKPFQIPTGTTVKIEGTLKGHPFSEDGTPSGNTVTFMVSKNMTAYSGRAWTKIKLTKDSKPVSSCGFWLDCDRAGVEADTVIGAPGFEEQIAEAAGAWLEDHGFSSPTIGVTEITGGHRITFTDAQHPQGQSIDVMDGTSVTVDPTLTIAGAAADALTVGEAFDSLNLPKKRQYSLAQGQWTQAHVWTVNAARVSPNPSVAVKKGDVLKIKIADGEKFAIAVWTVSGDKYTNREFGSYQFADLTRTFQMDCEVSVVIATTSGANIAPSDVQTKIEFLAMPENPSIVERVDTLWDAVCNEEDGTQFKYAYEWGEMAQSRNSYEAYPSGENANRERARAKQEYIRKVPLKATSVTVTIPVEMMCNGKYRIGWAFYGTDFDQLPGTVKGWFTDTTTFTAEVPSRAVYYMVYIATTSNQYSVDLSEINYSAASIVFNDSDTDHAKTPWYRHDETPKDAIPLTESPFLFSVNHRGYSADAPENTLPAFILSRKKGFRYVEADVLFTSDEVPVILHDDTINRTARNADGTEISASTRIDSITFEQARTFDFGIFKGSAYTGTKIPSFAEFIQLCKQLSVTPLIELKDLTSWTDARIDKVAYLIKAVGMQNHVAFISFSKTALSKMSAHFPRAMLGLGYENTYDSTNISALATDAADLKNGENTVFVSVRNSSMTSALFEILESNGISSFVWTVNSERDCVNLHRNVIGVLSDSLNAGKIIEDGLINS